MQTYGGLVKIFAVLKLFSTAKIKVHMVLNYTGIERVSPLALYNFVVLVTVLNDKI